MPYREKDATEVKRPARSCLGATLLRLQQNLEQTQKVDNQAEVQFRSWQEKWSSRRDQIAQRLALIDSQLEQLVQNNRQRPQLSLVGAAVEGDELLVEET